MKDLFTVLTLFFLICKVSFAQIEIDGDMLDWVGIEPLDQGDAEEAVGEIPQYPDFDLKHLYITHDANNVYVKIDLNGTASFDNFYNFDNPPVFEFYMDTEIGDTTGFDWGWWNLAMNYYVDIVTTLHPDSTEKYGTLYIYNGNRNPTWAEGEFVEITKVPMAVNDDKNSLEFSVPKESVNFGSEFRPWVYSVGNEEWTDGADHLPDAGAEYMLKFDFWYGGSVYQHNGTEIETDIEIDGALLDWVGLNPVDVDEISEETGDMPTGIEFDLKDIYVTSDSNNLYVRIDLDPTATFAGMYTNYTNPPAFQLNFDVNWGDTTGLGYGGFWELAVDYMVDLSSALNPDSTATEVPVNRYIADWAGAFEEFVPIEGVFASFAKNDEDNIVEIAIPRTGINVDTDVRPWIYVVGDENWDNEEYFPNTIYEGWGGEGEFYALNYNFVTGPSVHKIYDSQTVTDVDDVDDKILLPGFGLVSNYPNPFNPSTTITFSVSKYETINVAVYDILGRKIATLINNEEMHPGHKLIKWQGKDDSGNTVSSGVYFYSISSPSNSIVKKMMLMK
ncbi:MAG: T9SS type A sorting domain-containing protein [Ignavibacteria bacterium]|jgi:hypothetical protein